MINNQLSIGITNLPVDPGAPSGATSIVTGFAGVEVSFSKYNTQ